MFYFQPLDDNKTLGDYGFTFATARAQAPATIGLAFRQEGMCDGYIRIRVDVKVILSTVINHSICIQG